MPSRLFVPWQGTASLNTETPGSGSEVLLHEHCKDRPYNIGAISSRAGLRGMYFMSIRLKKEPKESRFLKLRAHFLES